MKYLIDDDELLNLILYINRGINDIKFTSRQIHLNNQLLDDIINTVLMPRKNIKVRLLIFINIKKRI
jgi:hypothetical protein